LNLKKKKKKMVSRRRRRSRRRRKRKKDGRKEEEESERKWEHTYAANAADFGEIDKDLRRQVRFSGLKGAGRKT